MASHRSSAGTRGALAIGLAAALSMASTAWAVGETAATLSVLSAPVERIAPGSRAERAGSGMDLAEGDRVRTGPGGAALITFLDGSTLTVLADSDVTVKQAPTRADRNGIRVLIHVGRVWARAVQALGRSSITLESNEYAAAAHDGLIGAERVGETFTCWTRRGELRLTERGGQADVVLAPGQRARARLGLATTAEPFVPAASIVEISTSGPVVPLLRIPESGQAAGFTAPGAEVNQVFGALTSGRGNTWRVEVPGGQPGAYTLVLTGTGDGPFTVKITGRYAGFAAYREEISGTIRRDEQVAARIVQRVSGDDPMSARVRGAQVGVLQAYNGGDDGTAVARPEAIPVPGPN